MLAFLVFLIAFLSQNMDKECASGCGIGEYHLLLKWSRLRQRRSQSMLACLQYSTRHPSLLLPSPLSHPVKPSNVDQMEKKFCYRPASFTWRIDSTYDSPLVPPLLRPSWKPWSNVLGQCLMSSIASFPDSFKALHLCCIHTGVLN